MDQQGHWQQRIILGIILVVILTGILIVVLDWREVRKVIDQANWWWVLPALFFTAFSFASSSYGFGAVCRIFGIRLRERDLFLIGFVSIAINNLITVAGLAGLSLRLLLLKRRGLETSEILAPSLMYSYLSNIAMVSLFPAGLIYLLVNHHLSSGQALGTGIATGIFILVLILATAVIFVTSACICWAEPGDL